jgi:hypothetical protein
VDIYGVHRHTIWEYKTVERYCDSTSGSSGIASCTHGIGDATLGFTVTIHVQFTYQGQTYSVRTWFRP